MEDLSRVVYLEGGQCIFFNYDGFYLSLLLRWRNIATCCYFLRGELVLGAFQVTTVAIASYARGRRFAGCREPATLVIQSVPPHSEVFQEVELHNLLCTF